MKIVIKLILFLNVLALFMCGVLHIVVSISGNDYPLNIYWIVPLSSTAIFVFSIYVIPPLFEKFLKL